MASLKRGAVFPGMCVAGAAGYRLGRRERYARRTGVVDPSMWRLLDVLREQWVVVDQAHRVVRQGKQLDVLGLVRDGELQFAQIREIAERARTAEDAVEARVRVEIGGNDGAQRLLDVRAIPVTDALVLIVVDDQTHAQRVEETRRDFVANVSHELKTPVGGLRLLAEAIEDAADDQDAVERFAGRMRVESVRLANLVQEIVDFSRLQVADVTQAAAVVDLAKVAARAVADMQLIADNRGIALRLSVPDGEASGATHAEVVGDEGLLLTAVRNLISNAINYSDADTQVQVDVGGNGHQVWVRVSDEGMGIAPADQARVFERFYRVDPARSRQTGGTGLGLAIVKHVVANHHGEVKVRSQVGVGSTFEILMPALDHSVSYPEENSPL